MRIHITNNREPLLNLVEVYTRQLLVGKKVHIIINGSQIDGIVSSVELFEDKERISLKAKTNENEIAIPLTDDTKITFGKEELIIFETKNHSTVIELLQ
ncbi:hypothetical protein IMZ31_21345 (plasmid) [Pontibacillus sp. ALD_SL1]|uniref:hypothetical protein n=1 Tax=Pontibacillus sp. ALD_SL1 TaxID=2777185 RepID=UPI001A970942|nr:hypothetical protein [Pontibacillus sp. ALD_SL1]QST03097.1 hypothetical protein IMZ31_21345 [Pontibacillus sp. ALD_SL1]